MFRILPTLSLIILTTTLMAGGWGLAHKVLAAPAYLVINEVQTSGGPGQTTNDFIELFNPTGTPVDLDGFRLVKRSVTGTTDTTIKSWTSSTVVPAYGYYLWANSSYTSISVTPDSATSQAISDDNGIALRQGPADAGTIIDSLAWGVAVNSLGEGALPANPEANQSLNRKTAGAGSRQDTADNSQDFEIAAPTPQNSSTLPEVTADNNGNNGGSSGSDGSSSMPLNPGTPNPGEVVINEFVSDPADGGGEWVELYNRTSRYIDLAGFTLEDGSGANTTLTGGLGADPSSRFLVIYSPKGNLNNEGDAILLKYQGQLIDQVSYGDWNDGTLGDNAPKAQDPHATGRLLDGLDSNNDQVDFALTQPTPGQPNKPPANTGAAITSNEQTDATVVLNELYPNPAGSDETGEWIELYNPGSQTVDLANWKISDAVSSHILVASGGPTSLTAGSYLLLPRSRTKIALNNSDTEQVRLTSPAGTVVASASYQGTATEGVSWARTITGSWSWSTTPTSGSANQISPINQPPELVAEVPSNGLTGQSMFFDASDTADPEGDTLTFAWDFGDSATSQATSPTYTYTIAGTYKVKLVVRDVSNNEVSKTYSVKIAAGEVAGSTASATTEIILSELIPNPEGSDNAEWIELMNQGETAVSTIGFKLLVGTRSYELPEVTIKPTGYAVINKSEVPFTLVNANGSAKLMNPAGEIVSQTEWDTAEEGKSWALTGNTWLWTGAPTPGEENMADPNNESSDSNEEGYEQVPLSEARLSDHSAKITVEGVVAAPPGLMTQTSLFLAGSGLQVSASGSGWPELQIGERVRLSGSISKSSSGTKLLVRTPKRLTRLGTSEPPQPHEVTLAELTEDDEGSLISITGQIEKVNKASFTLLQDNESIKVLLKNRALSWPELATGQQVKITGFLTLASGELTLWARSPEEVVTTTAVPEVAGAVTSTIDLSQTESSSWTSYLLLGGLGLVLAAAWVWNKKKLPAPGQLIRTWFSK